VHEITTEIKHQTLMLKIEESQQPLKEHIVNYERPLCSRLWNGYWV